MLSSLAMDLTALMVMVTVSTLFILGATVSRYFAVAGVLTLAVVLFYQPCMSLIPAGAPAWFVSPETPSPMTEYDAGEQLAVPKSTPAPMPSRAGDLRGEVAEGVVYDAQPVPEDPLPMLAVSSKPAPPRDTTLPTIERDGDDSEEDQALRSIEAARESFEKLDEDNAEKWGMAQDALIRDIRLNNMGDDENTVTYIHPDYVDKVGRRGGDMWTHDNNSMMGRNRAALDLELPDYGM